MVLDVRRQWQLSLFNRCWWVVALLVCCVGTACTPDRAQEQEEEEAVTNVFTRNYNNQRTGANLSETVLNVANVNASQFGKLFQLQVDDQIYAGLLYVSGVSIGGTTRNVLYVATVNNTVYAFDADTAALPL